MTTDATPDHVQAELDRLWGEMLKPDTTDERYCQMYAARQALSWAREPKAFDAPLNTIMRGAVQPLRTSDSLATPAVPSQG